MNADEKCRCGHRHGIHDIPRCRNGNCGCNGFSSASLRQPNPILTSKNGRVDIARKGLDEVVVPNLIHAEAMGGGDWFITVGSGPSMLRISVNRRNRVTVVERDDGKAIK